MQTGFNAFLCPPRAVKRRGAGIFCAHGKYNIKNPRGSDMLKYCYIPARAALERLGTDEHGLTAAEAAARLAKRCTA